MRREPAFEEDCLSRAPAAGFAHLRVDHPEEGVMLVTFDRPQVLNAVNTAMGQELLDLFSAVNGGAHPDVRAIVLTGAGERAFCVGGDLKERNGMSPEEWAAQRVIFKGYNREMERCAIPVICAVNGFALGGGAEMVLRTDFAYAAEHATFGFPEIKRGFMPGSGGTQRFARLAGEARAKEVLLTGQSFTAREAEAWGMVNRVLPAAEVVPQALATARIIASYSKEAVAVLKTTIHHGLQADLETGLAFEALAQQRLVALPDRLEGVAAFVEKRAAKFTR
jgi:enoyl-CoA hydratase/carnithine racemase